MDLQKAETRRLHQTIFSLLSCEKISFSDIQLKPYRTDEYIHRLFYETTRFTALNYFFVVKARINDDQKDPTMSCERKMSYSLVSKSRLPSPLAIHYLILKVRNVFTTSFSSFSNFFFLRVRSGIWRSSPRFISTSLLKITAKVHIFHFHLSTLPNAISCSHPKLLAVGWSSS